MSKARSKLPPLPPGFRIQAFGATLAAFGIIDTVMNLITGIALDGFFLFLIAGGGALFAIGTRQRLVPKVADKDL